MPDVAMPDLEDLHMCSTGPVRPGEQTSLSSQPLPLLRPRAAAGLAGVALLPWKACRHS